MKLILKNNLVHYVSSQESFVFHWMERKSNSILKLNTLCWSLCSQAKCVDGGTGMQRKQCDLSLNEIASQRQIIWKLCRGRSWRFVLDAYLTSIQTLLFRMFCNFQLMKWVCKMLKCSYIWIAHGQTEYAFKITNSHFYGASAHIALRLTEIWSLSLSVTNTRVLSTKRTR